MSKTLITEKRKCPICKKGYTIKGTFTLGFFIIEDDGGCHIYPYCKKECFEKAKQRGLWK